MAPSQCLSHEPSSCQPAGVRKLAVTWWKSAAHTSALRGPLILLVFTMPSPKTQCFPKSNESWQQNRTGFLPFLLFLPLSDQKWAAQPEDRAVGEGGGRSTPLNAESSLNACFITRRDLAFRQVRTSVSEDCRTKRVWKFQVQWGKRSGSFWTWLSSVSFVWPWTSFAASVRTEHST